MAVSPCDAIADRIYELLDGEMRAEDEADLRRHLAECAPCARAAERDEAFLRFLARRAVIEPAPASLRARVAAMLETARDAEPGSSSAPPASSDTRSEPS